VYYVCLLYSNSVKICINYFITKYSPSNSASCSFLHSNPLVDVKNFKMLAQLFFIFLFAFDLFYVLLILLYGIIKNF